MFLISFFPVLLRVSYKVHQKAIRRRSVCCVSEAKLRVPGAKENIGFLSFKFNLYRDFSE